MTSFYHKFAFYSPVHTSYSATAPPVGEAKASGTSSRFSLAHVLSKLEGMRDVVGTDSTFGKILSQVIADQIAFDGLKKAVRKYLD